MRQVTQKLMDGQLRVLEVPVPRLSAGQILVANYYSLISAGTEGGTVSAARKSLVGKARARPAQVKQVVDTLKKSGPVLTYRAAMKKLDAHSPMGYSCAGEVVDVAPDVQGIVVGDLVACGGVGYASHAEYVAVPYNLCVRLGRDSNLENAAYNTVGAIALQGVRQAELQLGETCVVIGLGLVGQLTCLLARANGARVVGIDMLPDIVDIARKHACDVAWTTSEPAVAEKVDEFTNRIGADAVIIAAATSSEEPINLAGRLLRRKGRVIIVGAVPTGFERDPYYKKELDLRMSCSYGPGRYDVVYEERGRDYPVEYVRWTENRNMQAFQQLLQSGRINLDYLTTHRFDLSQAAEAYDLILKREERYLGILIRYEAQKEKPKSRVVTNPGTGHRRVNVGFIGAGSYALNLLIPNIRKRDASLKGVLTSSGTSSRSVADRYGFEFCTSDEKDILNGSNINTVFVATRHDTHAEYVLKTLRSGRNVFVEKPLCLNTDELSEIADTLRSLHDPTKPQSLMVGFNRRFSPLTKLVKSRLGEGPMSMIYRVNAGPMPADSWMQIPEIGGGRIIGEACHFIDYLTYLNGSMPVDVHATAMADPAGLEDVVNISLRFENGSIGTVSYFSNGSKELPKEYVEVYRAGMTAIVDDFKEVRIYGGGGKPFKKKLITQDKGQPQMVEAFLSSIAQGRPSPIPFEELYAVMLATFRSIESLRTNRSLAIEG